MRYLLPILSIFIFISSIQGISINIKKNLGTEKDDYFFHKISGAVISNKNDIYVLEFSKSSLSKINWNGKLIKKFGKIGSGPTDMYHPRYLNIYDNKLFFSDTGNRRIGEIDFELNGLKYYKLNNETFVLHNFLVLNKKKVITYNTELSSSKNADLLRMFNIDNPIIETFFDIYPVNIAKKKKMSKIAFWESLFYIPVFNIHKGQKKILVSHKNPANPVNFYIYSISGQYIDDFSYKIDKKFQFPKNKSKSPTYFPEISYIPYIQSVHIYKKYYIASLILAEYRKRKLIKSNRSLLFFNQKTKILEKKINVSSHFKPLFISKSGILLARDIDDSENEVLSVYKIENESKN